MKNKHIPYNQNKFFDKYLFRPQDYIRIALKKLLSLVGLRNKQSCEYCGRDKKIVWSVKDEVWNRLSERHTDKSLCIECFVDLHPSMIVKEDFTYLSFIDPFRNDHTSSVPKKKIRVRRVETLQELIDNEPPNLREGMKVYIINKKTYFILRDGEWISEEHDNDTDDTENYLG